MSRRDNAPVAWETTRSFGVGVSRHFFISAFYIATVIAFFFLWSWTASVLTGSEEEFGIGKLSDILICVHGGGIMLFLVLIGSHWLALCGFLSRGAVIRNLKRRIEELSSRTGQG